MAKRLQEMRERVCAANKALPLHGLVKFTWGNVSEVCRELGRIVIKPSGVDYDQLTPENMVVTDLDGTIVEGELNPSSDLPTHVDRKSTRLNSSHANISYAVFCLKKK